MNTALLPKREKRFRRRGKKTRPPSSRQGRRCELQRLEKKKKTRFQGGDVALKANCCAALGSRKGRGAVAAGIRGALPRISGPTCFGMTRSGREKKKKGKKDLCFRRKGGRGEGRLSSGRFFIAKKGGGKEGT